MWKFNPFTPKEPTSLEGRYFDVGNVKVYVRNPIAEGGFSCVYLARDALHASKQYALKHIICNDEESLELVMKEVSVMKLLRGHPNIIQLLAHTVIDMGRTKEAFLVMEFCDRSLVAVLEKRGPAFFEEKQILLIFRDVCNAVFVMHCQLPSVAHRDLKAENILLGPGGAWKLCDFGSTSTDHKRFERPEEMGIEEDNIRKHTTPAYRAPEMWDLYRKEFISEKVDIWALGCLLYRICYFKSAFDGESKLQILNGNYRIPEVPQYSTPITQLIKDMLQASPASRPDITQVWFRVNEQLPLELQKHLPDGPPSAANVQSRTAKLQDEGIAKRTNLMPQKTSYHHAASKEQVLQLQGNQMAGGVGSFWSTHQHGQGQRRDTSNLDIKSNTIKAPLKVPENNLIQTQQPKGNLENVNISKTGKGEEAEVNQLKEQLKKANLEKSEITLKYQKLSEIWHSQKNEIQELKRALAAATTPLPQPKPESTNIHTSAVSIPVVKSLPAASTTLSQPKKESTNIQNPAVCIPAITLQTGKLEGGLWELEQAMFANCAVSPSPSTQPWQTFSEDPEPQPVVQNTTNPSVVSLNNNSWASFDPKPNIQDQPLGWAGF